MSIVKFDTCFEKRIILDYNDIEKLIKCGRELHALSVLDKKSGNLSFRTEKGFVISSANTTLGQITKNEFAEVLDLSVSSNDNITISANGLLEPSSESPVHWIIYQLKPEVNTIFHLHDELTIELAEELAIPVTTNFQVAGTYAMLKEVEKFLEQHPDATYFFMRDHGAIILAESIQKAFDISKDTNARARKLLIDKEASNE